MDSHVWLHVNTEPLEALSKSHVVVGKIMNAPRGWNLGSFRPGHSFLPLVFQPVQARPERNLHLEAPALAY